LYGLILIGVYSGQRGMPFSW